MQDVVSPQCSSACPQVWGLLKYLLPITHQPCVHPQQRMALCKLGIELTKGGKCSWGAEAGGAWLQRHLLGLCKRLVTSYPANLHRSLGFCSKPPQKSRKCGLWGRVGKTWDCLVQRLKGDGITACNYVKGFCKKGRDTCFPVDRTSNKELKSQQRRFRAVGIEKGWD